MDAPNDYLDRLEDHDTTTNVDDDRRVAGEKTEALKTRTNVAEAEKFLFDKRNLDRPIDPENADWLRKIKVAVQTDIDTAINDHLRVMSNDPGYWDRFRHGKKPVDVVSERNERLFLLRDIRRLWGQIYVNNAAIAGKSENDIRDRLKDDLHELFANNFDYTKIQHTFSEPRGDEFIPQGNIDYAQRHKLLEANTKMITESTDAVLAVPNIGSALNQNKFNMLLKEELPLRSRYMVEKGMIEGNKTGENILAEFKDGVKAELLDCINDPVAPPGYMGPLPTKEYLQIAAETALNEVFAKYSAPTP